MLVLALIALVAAPASAQMASPAKLQGVYERLCTGSGPASPATCAAMRRDMDAAGPSVSQGWLGFTPGKVSDGLAGAYVYSVWPGGPAEAAGIRPGDRVIAVNGRTVSDGTTVKAALEGAEAGRRVTLKLMRGTITRDVPVTLGVTPVLGPTLNASRKDRKPGSFWRQTAPTLDTIRLGEVMQGLLESSDGETVHGWGWRADCLEISTPAETQNLRVRVTGTGSPMWVMIQYDSCGEGPSYSPGTHLDISGVSEFELAAVAGRRTFLYIPGKPSPQPYYIYVREQTPLETVAFRERLRQAAVIEQQRRANEARAAEDRAEMFDLLMQGTVAVGQGYAAGMQEANEANARSQAIIDQAAAADRRYLETQRAAELARQAASRPQAGTPVQQGQAPVRRAPPTAAAAPPAPAQRQAASSVSKPTSATPAGAGAARDCKKVSQVRYIDYDSNQSMAHARETTEGRYAAMCSRAGWSCGAISCKQEKWGSRWLYSCSAPAREEVTFCDSKVSSE
ncbi:MAG: PDZ domain-containing protein [Phenylobacterium sp.]|uniref:S1C family serine protease n=1 Tax=Phenylobacterium sp. TaxID=1871053 RepID=UPI001B5C8D6A|nr:PDZ domain-containing protein [Phenylobacterium sp.]MBP7651161.1 PDZ domain-containing protein [Phenylobacterium sp.]MBP7816296.1 PDZ domain-containing protein [Phenylobacterium sp.]MBP9232301.1 PDZ domain-containing protein [Phenylobacterium sp.]MBP9754650.1 PDZ domain-containing protein [Phenylobacterium sp.]